MSVLRADFTFWLVTPQPDLIETLFLDFLKGHVYTLKKQFKRVICNNNFGLMGNLTKHFETVHEGKKEFKCDICDTKFGVKSKLKRHVATVHEGMKQFKCEICNASFGQKGDLNRHFCEHLDYQMEQLNDYLPS